MWYFPHFIIIDTCHQAVTTLIIFHDFSSQANIYLQKMANSWRGSRCVSLLKAQTFNISLTKDLHIHVGSQWVEYFSISQGKFLNARKDLSWPQNESYNQLYICIENTQFFARDYKMAIIILNGLNFLELNSSIPFKNRRKGWGIRSKLKKTRYWPVLCCGNSCWQRCQGWKEVKIAFNL